MIRMKKISLILALALSTQVCVGAISTKTVKALEQNQLVTMAETNSQTIIFVDGSLPTDATQNRYQTITEALAATPTAKDESERVVIEIADGTYREQIIVNKPYITFKSKSGDPSKVILTWYYGIGYVYNNIGTNGFYDANVDWSADSTWADLPVRYKAGDTVSKVTYYDKSGKLHENETVQGGILGKPDRWGCSTKLNSGAKSFIADGITFESSFNFEVTQEELDAGVTPEPGAGKPARLGLSAGSKEVEKSSYVERAAALHTDSDRTIIKNCIIRSKQDSLYIGSGRLLFDKCTIQGGTDYIFGAATAVFNECNLVFSGNSDNSDSGTVTAGSHSPSTQYGYLFWNCTVDYRLRDVEGKVPTPGTFGRPWSDPLGAQITAYNTTVKTVNGSLLISDAGWRDMTTKVDEARFYEFGTKDESGKLIDLSKRAKNALAPMGIAIDKWQILEFNPRNYLKGTDGWDPMDYAKNYVDVDEVLSNTTIDTNVSGNTISLPSAPAGYEFSWASDSEYAVVSDDKASVTVTRPAYGESAIGATVTLYAKNIATGFGDKKNISFQVQPNATAENTFTVNGIVSVKSPVTADTNLNILFKRSGVTIKKQICTIPAGQTSVNYTVQHIPAGTYDVVIETPSGYSLISPVVDSISGNVGETKTINLEMGQLITYTIKTTDFTEPWATITETATADGFSMSKYTVTGSESANLGEVGNVVYKFTKDANKNVPANVGGYFDLLAAVKADSHTLENADTLQFSYDFLLETADYLPYEYSYFDLATSLDNAGAGAADYTRFVRWGVHKGWTQFNMFPAANNRVNGDNTKFINGKPGKQNDMANRWFRIVADIDLKNQVITTTLYDRDANKILNDKAFGIASPGVDGTNPAYPTAADLAKALYFTFYANNKNTDNKIEYYIDNLELKYNDYESNSETPVPTITSVTTFSAINVVQGDTVSLPTTATAIYSDGSQKIVPIQWTPSTVDTSVIGVQTLKGTVEGYTGEITLNINVIAKAPSKDYTVNSVFNMDKLQANGLLEAKTTVTNNTSLSKSVIAIVALYDSQERMVNVSYISKNILAGETENLAAGFKLPANVTGYTVKVFVWDGTDLVNTTMQPISNTVILK